MCFLSDKAILQKFKFDFSMISFEGQLESKASRRTTKGILKKFKFDFSMIF